MSKPKGGGRGRGGEPPEAYRFKKGQSGNAKGRPRKEKVATSTPDVDRLLDRPFTVTINGRPQRVTISEYVLLNIGQRALKQDPDAEKMILKMAADRAIERHQEKANAPPPPRQMPTIIVRPHGQAFMEAIGLLTPHEGRKLVPAAVVISALEQLPTEMVLAIDWDKEIQHVLEPEVVRDHLKARGVVL